jgi:glucose-6-phosphate 1-dehydrogenase
MTLAENFGVEGRGRFYEEVGALRDAVQNHMLQVMTLLAMDAPVGRGIDILRDEKLRLLRAVRPLDPADVVRGQFAGYRREDGVAADSRVETFVALRLWIDSMRWSGVPFYIRAGKHLPVTAMEVVVQLKRLPQAVFDAGDGAPADYFRFRFSPEVGISLGARIKRPGTAMTGIATELVAQRQAAEDISPYERLFGDALRGDASLFTRDDCVEQAWRIVDPALDSGAAPLEYTPGSWGPAAADRLIAGDGRWRDPPAPEGGA